MGGARVDQPVYSRSGRPPRERNRAGVLQRHLVQQCVHPKGTRAKFIWVDTHRLALTFLWVRDSEAHGIIELDGGIRRAVFTSKTLRGPVALQK